MDWVILMKLKLSLILIFALICLAAWGCAPPQKPAAETGKTGEAVEQPAPPPETAPEATGPAETTTTEEGTAVEPGAEGETTETPSEGEATPEPPPEEPVVTAPAGPSGEKVFKDKCSSCHNTGEGAPMGLKGVSSKIDKAGLKKQLADHMGVSVAGAELDAVIDYVLSL
jgi:cytochrome c5